MTDMVMMIPYRMMYAEQGMSIKHPMSIYRCYVHDNI